MATAAEILAMIKEKDVKYVDVRFTDMRGQMQHVSFDLSLVDEDFLNDVRAKGDRLLRGLDELSGGRARGRGLMTAFETEDAPALAKRALTEQRLVVNATGPDTIRLEPPLTVTSEDIDDALQRLGALLGSRAA